TAAIPMRERDQWGWTGIRSPGRPRAPFVKPFPLTRPFGAPFPHVRPFPAPPVRPSTRPSRSPSTRPVFRPLVRPFARPFLCRRRRRGGLAPPGRQDGRIRRCMEDVLDLNPILILPRWVQVRGLGEGLESFVPSAQFLQDLGPARPRPLERRIGLEEPVEMF